MLPSGARTWSNLLCLVVFVWASSTTGNAQDDMYTCGGFLRSSLTIPFEKIKVKLLTTSGNMKAETEGTPNSGYYLLPVYDKGNYQLRVEAPNGWVFDPPSVDIDLNGQDPCSLGKDINFEFKGYSIFGKVVSKGSLNGPAGVEITLIDKGSTRKVRTQEGGNFVFPAVVPGNYQISFRGELLEANVKDDNLQLPEGFFVIEGYSLKGSIGLDGSLVSATVILANKGSVPCCSKKPSLSLPSGLKLESEFKVSCVINASPNGEFEFPCVKAATDYVLIAHVLTQSGLRVDVSPDKLAFDLAHSDTILPTFRITGYPQSGRIRNAGGAIDIRVIETGQETTTDTEGKYQLYSLKKGSYTLRINKVGFLFEDKVVHVDPVKGLLPDIEPDKFDVCGDVRIAASAEIEFTNARTNEVVKVRSEVSSGRFCTLLPKGEHIVRPKHSVRLSPYEVRINVPMPENRRLVFSQFSALVGGKVHCLDRVCAGVRVSLKGSVSSKQVAKSDGTFQFQSIDPGTYEICVSHERACFEKDCQPITVIDRNIDNVNFEQKGYSLRVVTSHEADLELSGRVIQLNVGASSHCVPETKRVPVKISSCHRFANEHELFFDPISDQILQLDAESHQLRVEIDSRLQVNDLKLTCTNGPDVSIVEMKQFTKRDDVFVYHADIYYPESADLIIEPTSDSLVFKPAHLAMRMPDDCHAITISGEIGLYIEGFVQPPIGGVEISVSTTENARPVKILTDSKGKYRAGPLDSTDYIIEASKEGYGFERIPNTTNIAAVKFSRIDILVQQEDDNSALPGALVSIAGGGEYRNTTKTGSRGELSLIKLNPGKYYVRVMMKEYKFEPVTQMVEVSEDSEERLIIKGKKVAYSVMGKVTSITGEIEPGVALEATSEQCDRHEEDAVSDETGRFRIRGLRGGCNYDVRLKFSESKFPIFERTLPASSQVSVERKDLKLDLIVVRPIRTAILSVSVRAEPLVLSTLRVVLYNSNQKVLLNLPARRFLLMPNDLPMDGSGYRIDIRQQNNKLPEHVKVRVISDDPLVGRDPSVIPEMFIDKPYNHLDLEVTIDESLVAAGSQANPGATPFFAVFALFAVLAGIYRKEIANFLRQKNETSTNEKRKNKTK